MKKTLLVASLSLLMGVSSVSYAEEVAFTCDFSDGLTEFTLYDEDGKSPNATAASFGFKAGEAWTIVKYDRNLVAASNSTHSPMSPAEDWLVTPAIDVKAGYSLTFKINSVGYTGGTKVGKYSVKVSTTGNAVADFTDVLVDKASAGTGWTLMGVDLSAYEGKTVYIAIINYGLSKDMLMVDDIAVGVPPVAYIDLVYNAMQGDASEGQTILGKVTAGARTTINSYTVTLTSGDFTTSRSYEELNVLPNKTHTFQLEEPLPLPTAGTPQKFSVSVKINDAEPVVETGTIYTMAYKPTKRVVAEESTGVECMWCPRGIYFMELMAKEHPDTFIGIAVHGGYNASYVDPMQVDEYIGFFAQNFGSGAPLGTVMRSQVGDPSDFPSYYDKAIVEPAWADVSVYAEWADESKTAIHSLTTTTFAGTGSFDTALELVLIENNVHSENYMYAQVNAYAGGNYGTMGGFENLPNPVPASQMYHQEVARMLITDVAGEGISESVPKNVKQDVAYPYYRSIELPSTIFVPDNCQLIALLLDLTTGKILNAAKCDIAAFNSGVKATESETFASRAYVNCGELRVELNTPQQAQAEVSVYAADGKLVRAVAPRTVQGATTIDCKVDGKGVYVVRVVCDGAVKTHKVVL